MGAGDLSRGKKKVEQRRNRTAELAEFNESHAHLLFAPVTSPTALWAQLILRKESSTLFITSLAPFHSVRSTYWETLLSATVKSPEHLL